MLARFEVITKFLLTIGVFGAHVFGGSGIAIIRINGYIFRLYATHGERRHCELIRGVYRVFYGQLRKRIDLIFFDLRTAGI